MKSNVALITNEALGGLVYLVVTEDSRKEAETLTPFHGQGMDLEVIGEWMIPDANATVNHLLDVYNYGNLTWKVGGPSHWMHLRPYDLVQLKEDLDYFSKKDWI
jgi:hypothetical protein